MERIIDKGIILFCCFAALFFVQQSTILIVGLLLALTVASLQEIVRIPKVVKLLALGAYLLAAIFLPVFVIFVPLMAYDCLREKNWAIKASWALPFLLALRDFTSETFAVLTLAILVASCLSWKTSRIENERENYLGLRDELRELSLTLEQKNRNLQEKQDYEVRLATLAERGRIAREIHDNVGHLLTRSVLQIEAAQVIHADDARLKAEFEQIGTTVHEAFETVRASVHDLHDDSFDLYTQLYALMQNSPLEVSLEYQCEEIPDEIGYGFVSIVRESIANTAKHSDATKAKVSLIEYPAFWQLIIHDNGTKTPFEETEDGLRFLRRTTQQQTGIFAGSIAKAEGIGLKTMEERTRTLGGVFRIDFEKGFKIFVSIPKEQA